MSLRSDAPAPPADTTELPFETALERLESLVDRLERGDLPLEAALASFEEGVRLSRHCAAQLDRAEQRISVLVSEDGELALRPYEEPEDTG